MIKYGEDSHLCNVDSTPTNSNARVRYKVRMATEDSKRVTLRSITFTKWEFGMSRRNLQEENSCKYAEVKSSWAGKERRVTRATSSVIIDADEDDRRWLGETGESTIRRVEGARALPYMVPDTTESTLDARRSTPDARASDGSYGKGSGRRGKWREEIAAHNPLQIQCHSGFTQSQRLFCEGQVPASASCMTSPTPPSSPVPAPVQSVWACAVQGQYISFLSVRARGARTDRGSQSEGVYTLVSLSTSISPHTWLPHCWLADPVAGHFSSVLYVVLG